MTTRTFTLAELAQVDLAVRIIALTEYADDLAAIGYPLQSRVIHHKAQLVYRAARAERLDPEPRLAPCGICHGVRSCDWTAHQEAL